MKKIFFLITLLFSFITFGGSTVEGRLIYSKDRYRLIVNEGTNQESQFEILKGKEVGQLTHYLGLSIRVKILERFNMSQKVLTLKKVDKVLPPNYKLRFYGRH